MNKEKIKEALEILKDADVLNPERCTQAIDEAVRMVQAELDKAPKVLTDERPWMNDWQRNMCKKSKGVLIRMIEEEREENDRLRHYLAPEAGLTVEEVMKVCWEWAIDAQMVNHTTDPYYLNGDLRSRLTAARAKDAEEIAKWKGIVKGVHGALNDIGTVPVPPLDADLYDAVMAIRAKDQELIQTLFDAGNTMRQWLGLTLQMDGESCPDCKYDWGKGHNAGCYQQRHLEAIEAWDAAAQGFKPSDE